MDNTEQTRNDIFRILDKENLALSKEDTRKRRYLFPKRVVWVNGQVENSDVLLKEREHQISLEAHEPCIMKSTQEEKASILLDYGVEIHGGKNCIFSLFPCGRKGSGRRTCLGVYCLRKPYQYFWGTSQL